MLRRGRPAAIALLISLLLAAGCSLDPRADASKGIARFLDAVRTGDRQAFEAAIDRPALRNDLREQLAELGRANGLDVEGGASDFALDRRIAPQAFRLANPGATSAQVSALTQVRDRSHACLTTPDHKACLLSFTKRDGAWRLTGMPSHPTPIYVSTPATTTVP